MMNPNVLLDLARERRRELLDDASRSRQGSRIEEPLAAEEALLVGRSALAIDARVRAEARGARRASAGFELAFGAR
jgi:hypothetical protein